MTTTSYPSVGKGGLTSAQWSVLYGAEDGIVEDYHLGAAPNYAACELVRGSDQVTITPGKVKVNGYILDISTAEVLACPPATATYYVGVMYDENLNVPVANTDPPQANPLGPCRLRIDVGPPTVGANQAYVLLWTVSRVSGQALSVATVTSYRQWRGPLITMERKPAADAVVGFGPFPRGTRLVQSDLGQELVRVPNPTAIGAVPAGTVLTWVNRDFTVPLPFPALSSLVSRDAPPSRPEYFFTPGGIVRCRGSLKRADGKNFSGTIGIFAEGARPAFDERFICKVSGSGGQVEIWVNRLGVVSMGPESSWVNLSGVSFRAEN